MRRTFLKLGLVGAGLLAASSANAHGPARGAPASPPPRPPSGRDRADIEALGNAWVKAWSARDRAALSGIFAGDAVLMVNNAPRTVGLEATLDYLVRPGPPRRVAIANEELLVAGDTSFLTAAYWMRIDIPGRDPIRLAGRSFIIHRRIGDPTRFGGWVIWRDMDNVAPDVKAEDVDARLGLASGA